MTATHLTPSSSDYDTNSLQVKYADALEELCFQLKESQAGLVLQQARFGGLALAVLHAADGVEAN